MDKDIAGMLILKMFEGGLLSEAQVMETLSFPNTRGRQKRKYIKSLLEKMKKYDEMWPGHLEEMIAETEGKLRG